MFQDGFAYVLLQRIKKAAPKDGCEVLMSLILVTSVEVVTTCLHEVNNSTVRTLDAEGMTITITGRQD